MLRGVGRERAQHWLRAFKLRLSSVRLPPLRSDLLSRLILAFALVLLLVLIANRAATNGGIILSTPSAERAAASPQPARQRPEPPTPLPGVDIERTARLQEVSGFFQALNSFEHEIDRRLADEHSVRVSEAERALLVFSQDVSRLESDMSGPFAPYESTVQVAGRARELIGSARVLIRDADARRRTRAQYWDALDVLDAELKSALDRNWKIFGRIIARESLLDMSRRTEEIRRLSRRVILETSFDVQASQGLIKLQDELAALLDAAVARNGSSKAGNWVLSAKAALGAAVTARTELQRIDGVEARGREAREQTRAALSQDVKRLIEEIATRDESSVAPLTATNSEPLASAVPLTAANSGPLASAVPLTATNSEPLTSAAPSPGLAAAVSGATVPIRKPENIASARHTTLLRWASLATLLLLLLICGWIVSSVVGPIRAFAASMGRFSSGDVSVRLRPAGILELDTLAEAFNRMAQELAQAQLKSKQYQEELEQRVHERTQQLQHLADHDELTALPNRRQLTYYLNLALDKGMRSGHRVAVFFLDLDNFKTINDSMGHAFGDLVLQAIAQRLRELLPPNAFAARLGGDEFTVIMEAANAEQVLEVGEELALAFQKPHIIESRELLVGVSLGASIFPDHETEADALLRAADAALFSAKSAGRSRLSIFQPALLEAASLKFRIEQGLRRAVERGEFELLYQPEVNLDQLETCAVEALLRWRQPSGEHISPGEFLVVAEESGLIMTISDWVVRSAVEQAAAWHHGSWPNARVAINVSARHLFDAKFDERLARLLEEYRLPASCIEIELTENVLQTGETTITMLRRLRKLGVSVALDDFGTGYSSLSSIEQLPLTRVKLDRSLIAEIDRQPRSLAIARAIITLCRDLGLEVTAEGIERPEQLALLALEPGLNLQGYLISTAVSAASVPTAVASLPGHLQSLLLTMPASARDDAETEEEIAAPVAFNRGA